jgi:lactoylglutathione lyase
LILLSDPGLRLLAGRLAGDAGRHLVHDGERPDDDETAVVPSPDRIPFAVLETSGPNGRRRHMRVNYAIVIVSDMSRAVAFYRDVVGLPLRFESPFWTEFATDGATLALHPSDSPDPARDDPSRLPAGRCRPGLSVPNLDEFHARMVQQNVPCTQPPTESFGARIAQYVDPDGLSISVSEQRAGR